MKIVGIGDIHGRDIWEKIVEDNQDADKIIFVGDYFDSYDNIPISLQLDNFKNILELKRDNKDKVVLLFGNHDYHYLDIVPTKEKYSGYQFVNAFDIKSLINIGLSEGLLQMCYIHDKYLFSHAGVSMKWLKINIEEYNESFHDLKNSKILEETINNYLIYKPDVFKFAMGSNFCFTGDDITQPPIWIRPHSLKQSGLDNYIHVVGHTVQRYGITLDGNILLIDALPNEYITIIDGTINIIKLK
jgi:predicted phosphodiesterase